MRPDAMRPRPERVRPRPNDLASRTHGPRGLNIPGGKRQHIGAYWLLHCCRGIIAAHRQCASCRKRSSKGGQQSFVFSKGPKIETRMANIWVSFLGRNYADHPAEPEITQGLNPLTFPSLRTLPVITCTLGGCKTERQRCSPFRKKPHYSAISNRRYTSSSFYRVVSNSTLVLTNHRHLWAHITRNRHSVKQKW